MSVGGRATLDWFSDRLNLTELLSILGSFGLIYVELDSREAPGRALERALSRPLASYARWPRVLGLSVVVLVILQIVTGALLSLYYLPTPATAHDSVAFIQRDVEFGALIHQIHFWGAQLLILTLMVRVVRYLAQGIYRSPRELEWLLALGLLAVAVASDLSGRLLPWSSDSYWFGVRLVEVLVGLPLVGSLFELFLGGEGTHLSGLTLIRAYGLHVAIAPAALLVLIYLHFSSVRRLGLNEVSREKKASGLAVLRRHLAEVAMVLVVAITTLVTLAVLFPRPFGCAADPYATLPAIRLPWHLLAPAGLVELTGGLVAPAAAGFALLLLALALALLPFADRRTSSRRLRLFVALAAIAGWLALSVLGFGGGR